MQIAENQYRRGTACQQAGMEATMAGTYEIMTALPKIEYGQTVETASAPKKEEPKKTVEQERSETESGFYKMFERALQMYREAKYNGKI